MELPFFLLEVLELTSLEEKVFSHETGGQGQVCWVAVVYQCSPQVNKLHPFWKIAYWEKGFLLSHIQKKLSFDVQPIFYRKNTSII